jgi:pimeloyl-ACP methyl ester carboxylesterase
MATYVLVHGAWHGGWCWHRIVARLEKAGHRALAPDLAGLGRDRTPPAAVTLASWVDAICALIDAENEPVVLVGHSRGGFVISQVAEYRPARVRVLVYVAAILLEGGQSLQDAARALADFSPGPALAVAPDGASLSVPEGDIRDRFYGECSDEDVVLARALLVPEPLAPLSTPLAISAANFGRIPRVYIECTRDCAITLAAQRRMQDAMPCRERYTLDTDHSPFLSRPAELATILQKLAPAAGYT